MIQLVLTRHVEVVASCLLRLYSRSLRSTKLGKHLNPTYSTLWLVPDKYQTLYEYSYIEYGNVVSGGYRLHSSENLLYHKRVYSSERRMSESPGSVMDIIDTLKNLPQAVPRSLLLPE